VVSGGTDCQDPSSVGQTSTNTPSSERSLLNAVAPRRYWISSSIHRYLIFEPALRLLPYAYRISLDASVTFYGRSASIQWNVAWDTFGLVSDQATFGIIGSIELTNAAGAHHIVAHIALPGGDAYPGTPWVQGVDYWNTSSPIVSVSITTGALVVYDSSDQGFGGATPHLPHTITCTLANPRC
jgi:hypothetical protein